MIGGALLVLALVTMAFGMALQAPESWSMGQMKWAKKAWLPLAGKMLIPGGMLLFVFAISLLAGGVSIWRAASVLGTIAALTFGALIALVRSRPLKAVLSLLAFIALIGMQVAQRWATNGRDLSQAGIWVGETMLIGLVALTALGIVLWAWDRWTDRPSHRHGKQRRPGELYQ